MSRKSVFCIANCRNQAELILDQLKCCGVSNKQISVLYTDPETQGGKSGHYGTDNARGVRAAGSLPRAAGAVVGGTLGWIMGIGPLCMPGVGTFIAAGPIVASLAGVAAGASVSGITGGLVGMGVSENQAQHYEARIRLGNLLISVHTESPAEAIQARFIFTRSRAQEICITDESCLLQERAHRGGDRSGLPRYSPQFWPELSLISPNSGSGSPPPVMALSPASPVNGD